MPNNLIASGACKKEKQVFSVFDQSAQSISFEHRICPDDFPLKFSTKDNQKTYSDTPIFREDILVQESINPGDDKSNAYWHHIFSIWKTGPLSDEDFVVSLIADTKEAQQNCRAMKDEDGRWKIGLHEVDTQDEGFAGSWVMYPPLSTATSYADPDGICGSYGHSLDNQIIIGIKDGIAIGYHELAVMVIGIDLPSITYENKG